MGNMNRDIKIELTMGEYIDLVSKANKMDELKANIIGQVEVSTSRSMFDDNKMDLTVRIGSGKEFFEERLEKMYEMLADNEDAIEYLFRKGKRHYCIDGDYFTDSNFGKGYKDLFDIPKFKATWEALEEERDKEVVEAAVVEEVEVIENEQ